METTYTRPDEGSPRRKPSAEALASLAVLRAQREERRKTGENDITTEEFNRTRKQIVTVGAGAIFEAYNAKQDAQQQQEELGEDTERRVA